MVLKRLEQSDPTTLRLMWDDGHQEIVSLRTVRDACPCAGCQGETVLFSQYVPPPADSGTPGRYDLRAAVPVGNYALKFAWGDGHDEGIYTWEHLRRLCECPECQNNRARGGR
jgi:DUF971 family protein